MKESTLDVTNEIDNNLSVKILRAEIAQLMAEAIDKSNMTRKEIADSMSNLLGKKFSKYMLDAYTSKSRQEHIPPLDVAIAFDTATKQNILCEYFSEKLDGKFLANNELPIYHLGKITKEKELLLSKEKKIKLANGILSEDVMKNVSFEMLEEESNTYQHILAWLIANCESNEGINFLRGQANDWESTESSKQKYNHMIKTLDDIREIALIYREIQKKE